MIRRARMEDMPAIVRMGRDFFDESGFGAETEFDEDSLRRTVEHLLSGAGVILLAERNGALVGGAGAISFPYYFNLSCTAAQELFWWIAPEARGGPLAVRLLHALEEWAKAEGCATLTMISLPALESPASRIYARFGYRPSEHSFIKRMN